MLFDDAFVGIDGEFGWQLLLTVEQWLDKKFTSKNFTSELLVKKNTSKKTLLVKKHFFTLVKKWSHLY